MSRLMVSLFVIAAWVVSVQSAVAHAADVPSACGAEIDSRLRGWRLSPPPADLAAYAKERKLQTNIARADLDGDGTRDTAVLVVAPSGGGNLQDIAICLERKGRPQLHLIREPYWGDGITIAPKGQTAYNF